MITTVYTFNSGVHPPSIEKAACFDLDHTLVKPKYGTFPRTYDDNVIMNNRVQTLKKYVEANIAIVVFSNQKLTNKENLEFKVKRMNHVLQLFKDQGIPMIIYIAIADDKYRKPDIGMWEEFKKSAINIKQAFYCGDAAGRPGDFSDSDLKFAENIKTFFYLPERIFGEK